MTAEELQRIAKVNTPALAEAFTAMLVDWGYKGLKKALVSQHITSFMAGDPEPEGNIIAKFVYGWLNDGVEE